MQHSNHCTLSHVIVHMAMLRIYCWQKMVEKCAPSAKQHEFNNKNRIVCVWEAQLFKAVTLNLIQLLLHVIPFLSYFLHLCIHK